MFPCSTDLHDILVDLLGVSVDQVDLLGVAVLHKLLLSVELVLIRHGGATSPGTVDLPGPKCTQLPRFTSDTLYHQSDAPSDMPVDSSCRSPGKNGRHSARTQTCVHSHATMRCTQTEKACLKGEPRLVSHFTRGCGANGGRAYTVVQTSTMERKSAEALNTPCCPGRGLYHSVRIHCSTELDTYTHIYICGFNMCRCVVSNVSPLGV